MRYEIPLSEKYIFHRHSTIRTERKRWEHNKWNSRLKLPNTWNRYRHPDTENSKNPNQT